MFRTAALHDFGIFTTLPGCLASLFRSQWLWTYLRARARTRRAVSWPTIEGRVETFYVAKTRNQYVWIYVPILQYSYEVADERYSGSFALDEVASTQDSAGAAARAWVGKKISVRYNPSQPETSTWMKQDGAPEGTSISRSVVADANLIDPELNK